MPKKNPNNSTPNNHKANQANANKGADGVNKVYAKVQGNRGKQKNPNNKYS